ncbi:MAG TPA: flagellar hook-associated protein FlgL [Egibacteraceae bacterium]|nr:flagellar hook-associated protein FlgL [Egibacteraceae bacterium]
MSTAFRITQRSVAQRTNSNLQYALSRLAKTQEQLSSGRLISRPSDSPVGTVSALRFRAEIRQTEQFARNADDGLAWLGNADRMLTSSLDQVRRARELTLQGANGSAGPDARNAIALEIEAIRDSLLGIANSQHAGRPLFGGTGEATRPYAPDGSYIADPPGPVVVARAVAPGESVRINITGPEVFGPEGANLFDVLTQIADDLRNDPAGLAGGMNALDERMRGITDALGDIGARTNRLEVMRDRAVDQIGALKHNLSEVEDIDLPATIMDLQLQETAYKAALSATARVLQPSLVDFLR